MTIVGVAAILAAYLIPVHGMMGIQAAFKLFSHPAAEMKAVGFMMVLLFASAAAAAASFFLPFLGNLSKYLSYDGITFWWGAAVALMTAMNVFGPHPEIPAASAARRAA